MHLTLPTLSLPPLASFLTLAATWTHEPHRFIVQFSETFGIRWYGFAYVLGFLAGAWLLNRYARATPPRSQIPAEKTWDLIIALVLGVAIGGRLGYFLFYQPADLLNNPLVFFKLWEGGMASHGGFIGVGVALLWFARRNKIPAMHVADLVATITSPGLFFGRIANYLNGELWGKLTDGTWGVIFEKTEGGPLPRHPSQLYEAALEGALLFAFAQWRLWRTGVTRVHPGRLAGEYLCLYAIVRSICEIFREPDVIRNAAGQNISLILGLSRGTFYSIFIFAIGLAFIAYAILQSRQQHPPEQRSKVNPKKRCS